MDIAEKHRVCVDALRDFAEETSATDVVIGLSGGIDSSLVACLCCDVFGSEHVHGVLMPGPYSTSHSLIDAQELARALGIETQQISINEPFQALGRILSEHMGGFGGIAAENTQARCRMIILMAISNMTGWLVVNTGNRSEAMMGYSTLYGDTVGAFAPIGGLYKTDVFAASRFVNEQAEASGLAAPIPENVLIKPPSAELAPDQRDEDALGAYETLDAMLIEHIEHGVDREGLVARGFVPTEVDRMLARVKANAFKREMEPPCPRIPY